MESYKVIIRSNEHGSNKSLLKKGLVPGIIYGKGSEATKIAFENQQLQKLMKSGSFYTKIIDCCICYTFWSSVFLTTYEKFELSFVGL